jgi:hypothetical protein
MKIRLYIIHKYIAPKPPRVSPRQAIPIHLIPITNRRRTTAAQEADQTTAAIFVLAKNPAAQAPMSKAGQNCWRGNGLQTVAQEPVRNHVNFL